MADFDGLPGGLAPARAAPTKDQDDTAATFSNFAAPGSPDAAHVVAAPGVCITSTWNDGRLQVDLGHLDGLAARGRPGGPLHRRRPLRRA